MSGILLPYLGTEPRVAGDAFVAPTATLIGRVTVGSGSSIWYGCVLRGDDEPITIGENTNVQDGTVIHVTKDVAPTIIGDNIVIGHSALIHACTLEDGCFVGMGATVLDKAVVETGAMVAAGAMVTPGKRVPTGELWAGSPAKFFRKLTEDEVASWKPQADHYRMLGENHARSIAGAAADQAAE